MSTNAGIRIYLAGPISGCNEKQCTHWRKEFRKTLGAKFDYDDPMEWGRKPRPEREMKAISQAGVIVANMWKESVGTTIGIFHARMSGKPVVLIDPNYIQNPTLEILVKVENIVHDIEAATHRVKDLAGGLRKLPRVRKHNGQETEFSQDKLLRSIKTACARAGVDSSMFPLQVIAQVEERLRALRDRDVVDTSALKTIIHQGIDSAAENPIQTEDFIKHAGKRVKTVWEEKEKYKPAEHRFKELLDDGEAALKKIGALEWEIGALKEKLARADEALKIAQPPASLLKPPKSVGEAVQVAEGTFGDVLIFTEHARNGALKSPFREADKVLNALECLASYARNRREAGSRATVGLKEKLHPTATGLAWLSYAPYEHESTMNQWAAERTVVYEGQSVTMKKHLKIGSGNPNHGVRIYFEFVGEEKQQFLIGHVGRHPTNTQTS